MRPRAPANSWNLMGEFYECTRKAGRRVPNANAHSGIGTPFSTHSRNRFANSAWLNGGSVRPSPGSQPQSTSLSSRRKKKPAECRSARALFDPTLGAPTVLERIFTCAATKGSPMKFAFLGYGLEQEWDAMSRSEQDSMFDDCFGYDSKLLRDGYLVDDGAALQSSRNAKTLRWHNGKVLVTDGPYAETKEQLGGIGVLEANDMAHAIELMSGHPGLHYGATFEVRPIDEESFRRKEAAIAALRS